MRAGCLARRFDQKDQGLLQIVVRRSEENVSPQLPRPLKPPALREVSLQSLRGGVRMEVEKEEQQIKELEAKLQASEVSESSLERVLQEESSLAKISEELTKRLEREGRLKEELERRLKVAEAQCSRLSGRLQLQLQMSSKLQKDCERVVSDERPELTEEVIELLKNCCKSLGTPMCSKDLASSCASVRRGVREFRDELLQLLKGQEVSAERSVRSLVLALCDALKAPKQAVLLAAGGSYQEGPFPQLANSLEAIPRQGNLPSGVCRPQQEGLLHQPEDPTSRVGGIPRQHNLLTSMQGLNQKEGPDQHRLAIAAEGIPRQGTLPTGVHLPQQEGLLRQQDSREGSIPRHVNPLASTHGLHQKERSDQHCLAIAAEGIPRQGNLPTSVCRPQPQGLLHQPDDPTSRVGGVPRQDNPLETLASMHRLHQKERSDQHCFAAEGIPRQGNLPTSVCRPQQEGLLHQPEDPTTRVRGVPTQDNLLASMQRLHEKEGPDQHRSAIAAEGIPRQDTLPTGVHLPQQEGFLRQPENRVGGIPRQDNPLASMHRLHQKERSDQHCFAAEGIPRQGNLPTSVCRPQQEGLLHQPEDPTTRVGGVPTQDNLLASMQRLHEKEGPDQHCSAAADAMPRQDTLPTGVHLPQQEGFLRQPDSRVGSIPRHVNPLASTHGLHQKGRPDQHCSAIAAEGRGNLRRPEPQEGLLHQQDDSASRVKGIAGTVRWEEGRRAEDSSKRETQSWSADLKAHTCSPVCVVEVDGAVQSTQRLMRMLQEQEEELGECLSKLKTLAPVLDSPERRVWSWHT